MLKLKSLYTLFHQIQIYQRYFDIFEFVMNAGSSLLYNNDYGNLESNL